MEFKKIKENFKETIKEMITPSNRTPTSSNTTTSYTIGYEELGKKLLIKENIKDIFNNPVKKEIIIMTEQIKEQ
jgi:hypothetical protein